MKIHLMLKWIFLICLMLSVFGDNINESGNKKQIIWRTSYLKLKYENANHNNRIKVSTVFKYNFETRSQGQGHSQGQDLNIHDIKNIQQKGEGHLSHEAVNTEEVNNQLKRLLKSEKKHCIVSVPGEVIPVSCHSSVFETPAVPEEATVFKFDKVPTDSRLLPEIGNGHLATVLFSDTIYMNGLYNGASRSSHRARIPSTVSFNVTAVSPANSSRIRVLDMGRGVYYERYEGQGYSIEVRQYAHRSLSRLLVVQVIMKRDGDQHLSINLTVNSGVASEDISFRNSTPTDSIISVLVGNTKEAEYPNIAPVTPVTVFSNKVAKSITIHPGTPGQVSTFLTSISTNKEEAEDYFKRGMALAINGRLFSSHVDAWTRLWKQGHIDLRGNLTLSRITYAAQYYLLSSLPTEYDRSWPFVGLAPGGLAHGGDNRDYMGHVFWDQDTWMFPPILLLHSDIGKLLIDTRIRTLNTAILNAAQKGYKGARYPWESGYTGLEVSPSETCGDQEIHITGDICLAFKQYLQLTNDTEFLTSGQGKDAIFNMTDFWISRMVFNRETGKFEIHDVMPPDEYHSSVDNSVYTNAIARECIVTAMRVNDLLGKESPRQWSNITLNMYIPFDAVQQYHPEFDGYTPEDVVKQADVVMLNYPLMAEDRGIQVIENDLNIYEKATPGGPAMTWGIFTINWLQLGNKIRADSFFQRTIVNAQRPFFIWTEEADGGGATNFHTGMGGYLQCLIFGYGGFKLYNQQLDFNPSLPPSTTTFSLTGIDYANNSFDFVFEERSMTVTLTHETRPVGLLVNRVTTKMNLGQNYTYARGPAAIIPL